MSVEVGFTVVEKKLTFPDGKELEVVSGLDLPERLGRRGVRLASIQLEAALVDNQATMLLVDAKAMEGIINDGRAAAVMDGEEIVSFTQAHEYPFTGKERSINGEDIDYRNAAEAGSMLGHRALRRALKQVTRQSPDTPIYSGTAYVAMQEGASLAAAKYSERPVLAVTRVTNVGAQEQIKKAGLTLVAKRESWRNGTANDRSEAGLIFHKPDTPLQHVSVRRRA